MAAPVLDYVCDVSFDVTKPWQTLQVPREHESSGIRVVKFRVDYCAGCDQTVGEHIADAVHVHVSLLQVAHVKYAASSNTDRTAQFMVSLSA